MASLITNDAGKKQLNSSTMTATPTQLKFHIFGQGISFSMSPIIHMAAFHHHHLPYTYDIRETETVDEVADLIEDESFGGASVTMPHKTAVSKFCDDQTEHAEKIGAINTLIVQRTGEGRRRIIGDNTDWSGLHAVIVRDWQPESSGPHVGLVIGAGGASRAALYSLHQAGITRIYIANRTLANAEQVVKDLERVFPVHVVTDIKNMPEAPEVIIGTIPADKTVEDTFSTLFSRSRGLCIDMAYKPRLTPLLKIAERHGGWKTVTGVEILLYQAFDQSRLWTGLQAPQEVMATAVEAHDEKMELARTSPKL